MNHRSNLFRLALWLSDATIVRSYRKYGSKYASSSIYQGRRRGIKGLNMIGGISSSNIACCFEIAYHYFLER